MTYTHINAPTQFVQANGISFAHRRFGTDSGVPLLFLPHFRAGMDHWDPAVTDGFAKDRPVILFDNARVACSSGETPNTIDAMAEYVADFVNAPGLSRVDLLGFSIGGFVAQVFALRHPKTVGRLMLVGTSPRGGEPSNDPNYAQHAASTDPSTGESGIDAFLYLFFSHSERGQAAGRAFSER
jgi:pimeloyl-ACP methyl ester carboxylesterase